MTRVLAALVTASMLAACGASSPDRGSPGTVTRVATGSIANACLNSGRKAANRQLCGCIQFAADQSLSGSDQRRGAAFFGAPEKAHAVRLSDTPSADAFWERWTNFGKTARKLCG
jgi:hypothetical protein